MNNKTELFTNILMYVIMAISVVMAVFCVWDPNIFGVSSDSAVGTIISWTAILLGLGVLGAVASGVVGVLTDPKGLVKTLITVVGVVALIGICWALSDDTPLKLVGYEGDQNQGDWLKIADTSLFLTYIGLGVAVAAIVVNKLVDAFK